MLVDEDWERFISWDNLLSAFVAAARGKRGSRAVARWEYRLGDHLIRLQSALREERWRPGAYRTFALIEAKRRWIAAAPFVDRIVHHALCNVIEARFETTFIDHSYANRKGRGTLRALDAFSAFASRYRYALRLDVHKHFASINHEVLRGLLYERVRSEPMRRIISHVINSWRGGAPGDSVLCSSDEAVGLPIGNLTSQFWSNCYLDTLDHFVRTELGHHAYIRYVDDIVLLSNDRRQLNRYRASVIAFLQLRLKLEVHRRSAQAHRAINGIPWLGCVVYPTRRSLKSRKVVEATRQLCAWADAVRQGCAPRACLTVRLCSWLNYASRTDRETVAGNVVARVNSRLLQSIALADPGKKRRGTTVGLQARCTLGTRTVGMSASLRARAGRTQLGTQFAGHCQLLGRHKSSCPLGATTCR